MDTDNGICTGHFTLNNRWTRDIGFMMVELLTIDDIRFSSHLVTLAVMPLTRTQPTDASIILAPTVCDQITRIVVQSVPVCQDTGGTTLDCLSPLTPSLSGDPSGARSDLQFRK